MSQVHIPSEAHSNGDGVAVSSLRDELAWQDAAVDGHVILRAAAGQRFAGTVGIPPSGAVAGILVQLIIQVNPRVAFHPAYGGGISRSACRVVALAEFRQHAAAVGAGHAKDAAALQRRTGVQIDWVVRVEVERPRVHATAGDYGRADSKVIASIRCHAQGRRR